MSLKPTNNLTPERITNLLVATRHNGDLCVPECKDGPSMGRKSRRLDLWTMKRSYIRDWLDNKKELHTLGHQVAYALKRKVSVVERKNADLEKRIASLEYVERFWTKFLGCRSSELGGSYSHYLENANRRKAESLALILTPELRNDLRAAQSHLKAAARAEQSLDDVFEALKEIEKFKT